MKLVFSTFLIVALLCNLIWISWTDLRTRIITNRAIFMTALLILLFGYILWGKIFIFPAIISLFIGFIMFMLNIIGAGDIKLISVLMLAVPPEEIISFLFFITIVGAVIALIGLVIDRAATKQKGIPYGIAIVGGFVINFSSNILTHFYY